MKNACLVILLIAARTLSGQNYIGVSWQGNRDFFTIDDPAHRLQVPRYGKAVWGFEFRHQRRNFSLTTGLLWKRYQTVLYIPGVDYGLGSIGAAIKVPVQAGFHKTIGASRFSIFGFAGMEVDVVLTNHFTSYGESQVLSKTDTMLIKSSAAIDCPLSFLVSAGAGLEYLISKRYVVSLYSCYSHGLNPVYREHFNFYIKTGVAYEAKQTYYGSYLTIVGLRLFYRISPSKEEARGK